MTFAPQRQRQTGDAGATTAEPAHPGVDRASDPRRAQSGIRPVLHGASLGIQRIPDTDVSNDLARAPPESAGPLATPAVLLVDDGQATGPGQMTKSAFLARLRAAAETTVAGELEGTGWSAESCPWLAHWFDHYADQPAPAVQRAMFRYVPATRGVSSAEECIPLAAERVRQSVRSWVRTGRIDPEIAGETGQEQAGPPPGPGVAAKAEQGATGSPAGTVGPGGAADPAAIQAQLGAGSALDGGQKARMGSAFGQDFSSVRVHTDPRSAALASSLRARAFTVGQDVVFGQGQYRPDSLAGDALLAHELAHVVQQRGGSSGTAPRRMEAPGGRLERQADQAAVHVLTSLWSPETVASSGEVSRMLSGAPGGLRLQRCDLFSSPEPSPQQTPPVQPPAPTPEEQMRAVLTPILADLTIEPDEWRRIQERSRALGVGWMALEDLARDEGSMGSPAARAVGLIGTRPGAAMDAVRGSYTATFTEGDDRLSPDPLPVILEQAAADRSLDFNELDTLRSLADDFSELRAAFTAASFSPGTVNDLMRVIEVGGRAWNSLGEDPAAMPIALRRNTSSQLEPTGDLRVVFLRAVTGDGAWTSLEFPSIRALLSPLGRSSARTLLESAGFETFTADQLAKQFTAPDAEYRQRMPQSIQFRRDGRNFALVTPMFPEDPGENLPTGVFLRHVGTTRDVGDYTFRSGVTVPADEQIVEVNGRRVPMLRPNGPDDGWIRALAIIRANEGLAPVPAHHLALIQRIVVDPGELMDAAADAGYNGVVTLYMASARGGAREARRILVHEVGHLVSFNASRAGSGFWRSWEDAARQDDAAVSVYGTTDRLEDFAEAYLMFIVNRSAMQARFPHRYAIVDRLVSPPAAPPAQTP